MDLEELKKHVFDLEDEIYYLKTDNASVKMKTTNWLNELQDSINKLKSQIGEIKLWIRTNGELL